MHIPEILQNRAYLLIVIGFLTTMATLGPFFLEEFTLKLIAHEALHVAAITFGIFLIMLSILAYHSTKNSNMIFTALAFLTFTILSVFLLQEDLTVDYIEHKEAIYVDVLLTIMIGFFAIGVFFNQKFPTRRTYD